MKVVSWGNGEPCPFCGKEFKKADYQHVLYEHGEELIKALFEVKKN